MDQWTMGLDIHIRSAAYSFMLASHKPRAARWHAQGCLHWHCASWNTATSDYSMKVVIHRSICTVLWFIFNHQVLKSAAGGETLRAVRPSVNYVPIELQDRRKHYKWSSDTYKKINKNLNFLKSSSPDLSCAWNGAKLLPYTLVIYSATQTSFISSLRRFSAFCQSLCPPLPPSGSPDL